MTIYIYLQPSRRGTSRFVLAGVLRRIDDHGPRRR